MKSNYIRTMFYTFLWMILQLLNFISRRFGTLCLLHLHRWCKLTRREGSQPKQRMQHSRHGRRPKSSIFQKVMVEATLIIIIIIIIITIIIIIIIVIIIIFIIIIIVIIIIIRKYSLYKLRHNVALLYIRS